MSSNAQPEPPGSPLVAPIDGTVPLRFAIGIATTGRPRVVSQAIERHLPQLGANDRIIVVGADPADLAELPADPRIYGATVPKGLCRQRNEILRMAQGVTDVVAFLDDDFVAAPSFLRSVRRLLTERPDIVGATGEVLADGIHGEPISFEEADGLVQEYELRRKDAYSIEIIEGAYGCNMVVRLSAAQELEFDEELPLYGWQEDIDYTCRLGRRGLLVRTDAFAGIHLGVRSGRLSGKRLGYSQVVNPLYLVRKGTMRRSWAMHLISRNIMANAGKFFASETHIDRKGRLAGNLIGLSDLLRGRAHPKRILDMT